MLVDTTTEVVAERALELPQGDSGKGRQPRARQRRFEVRFHGFQDSEQLLIGYVESKAQVHALRPLAFTHVRVQEPVADSRAELVAVIACDERDHHVEPRDPAGTGNTVAIELEQRAREFD
ncbi:MAG: hypothetical protein JWN85_1520, partial [Gammaproteobacteria bacterium]|nr:hypothetical protein [Gammaproteobacteria bacterium]